MSNDYADKLAAVIDTHHQQRAAHRTNVRDAETALRAAIADSPIGQAFAAWSRAMADERISGYVACTAARKLDEIGTPHPTPPPGWAPGQITGPYELPKDARGTRVVDWQHTPAAIAAGVIVDQHRDAAKAAEAAAPRLPVDDVDPAERRAAAHARKLAERRVEQIRDWQARQARHGLPALPDHVFTDNGDVNQNVMTLAERRTWGFR